MSSKAKVVSTSIAPEHVVVDTSGIPLIRKAAAAKAADNQRVLRTVFGGLFNVVLYSRTKGRDKGIDQPYLKPADDAGGFGPMTRLDVAVPLFAAFQQYPDDAAFLVSLFRQYYNQNPGHSATPQEVELLQHNAKLERELQELKAMVKAAFAKGKASE